MIYLLTLKQHLKSKLQNGKGDNAIIEQLQFGIDPKKLPFEPLKSKVDTIADSLNLYKQLMKQDSIELNEHLPTKASRKRSANAQIVNPKKSKRGRKTIENNGDEGNNEEEKQIDQILKNISKRKTTTKKNKTSQKRKKIEEDDEEEEDEVMFDDDDDEDN